MIKIINNSKKETPFKEVSVGEVFQDVTTNIIYLKTDEVYGDVAEFDLDSLIDREKTIDEFKEDFLFNAYDIHSREFVSFRPTEKVIILNAELHIS